MNRLCFEALRDLPEKKISEDIRFSRRQALAPVLCADGIRIRNSAGIELLLSITCNPLVGSKSFNVHAPGIGPICRLDVDGRPTGCG